MSDAASPHGFQFASDAHQRETAISGMWVFLATEALFFGPLFLAFAFSRQLDMAGFDAGGSRTNLLIGAVNTFLLVTSSLFVSLGAACLETDRRRVALWSFCFAWVLGLSFMALKFGVEWRDDFRHGLFPGAGFSAHGDLRGGMELFFTFYFISTGVHGLHLLIGLLLLAWIIRRLARHSPMTLTPVLVVALYWSFVDLVWIILFPLIYLVGRGG